MEDEKAQYEKAKKALSEPDSIMEPDIVNWIDAFQRGEGTIEEMVNLFVQQYKGYAQMTNIALHWLYQLGHDEEKIETLVTDQIKEKISEHTDRKSCNRIFESLKVDIEEDVGETSLMNRPDQVGFNKFVEKMETQLFVVLNQGTEKGYQEELIKFCRIACISELCYYITRSLLHYLDYERKDWRLQLISAKLQQHASKITSTTTLDIISRKVTEKAAVRAVMEEIQRSGTSTTADITRIANLDVKSVRQLQSSKLFHFLVELLFVPQEPSLRKLQIEASATALAALSYGKPLKKDQPVVCALINLASLCQEKEFGAKLIPVPRFLLENLENCLFARGVVRWIKYHVSSASYFRTTYESDVTPLFVNILGFISSKHKLIRESVFEVLWSILTLFFPNDFSALEIMELHKKILPLLTHLVHLGLGPLIFKRLSKNSDRIDRSILREFLILVCDSVAYPVPDDFLDSLGLLLRTNTLNDALRTNIPFAKSFNNFLVTVPGHLPIRQEFVSVISSN